MNPTSLTVSLVPEAKGGPFIIGEARYIMIEKLVGSTRGTVEEP